jgi:thiol-disulfide isomerase/thioredoxin
LETINLFYAFFLPAAVWLIIKPYLHDKKQDQETKFEYKRFKNNPEIFGSLLNGQEAVKNSLAGLGILLGNADAPNTLTKICNPYCGPCAQSFPHLQELLKNHGDQWNVQIIFMATPDERDERALPVAHFFAIQESDNADQVINVALADWYNAKTKDYNAYKIKYPVLVNFDRLKHKLEEMSNWCNLENIQFTPTYYVNGRRLPESYSISDLGNIF